MKESKFNFIIAIPNTEFAEGLKSHIERRNAKVKDIVVVLEHLIETIDGFVEDGEKIDGILLSTDLSRKLSEKRLEILSDTLLEIRKRYSDISIIVLSNEKVGHPLLAEMVQMGIYNIFVKGKDNFSIDKIFEIIKQPRTFAEVSEFLEVDEKIKWSRMSNKHSSVKENLKSKADREEDSPKKEVETKVKEIVKKEVIIKDHIVHSSSMSVAFVNLTMRAGSSFLSTILAKGLSESKISTTLIDFPDHYEGKTYLYDLIGLHIPFKDNYYSLHHDFKANRDISKHTIKQQKYEGVNWQVIDPHKGKVSDWTKEEILELLFFFNDHIRIVDFGYMPIENMTRILKYIDHIFFVASVSPHDLMANMERIDFFNQHYEHLNGHLVLNNWEDKLKFKRIRDLFPNQKPIKIPHLNNSDIIRQLFKGRIPYEQVMSDELAKENLKSMMQTIVPDLSFGKKVRSPFKRLKNIKTDRNKTEVSNS